jgi:hypothetical protein
MRIDAAGVGTTAGMGEFQPADHAMGLELQIEELIEQRERAAVQGRDADARSLEREIEALQVELAVTAERAALAGPQEETTPRLHNAEELSISDAPD